MLNEKGRERWLQKEEKDREPKEKAGSLSSTIHLNWRARHHCDHRRCHPYIVGVSFVASELVPLTEPSCAFCHCRQPLAICPTTDSTSPVKFDTNQEHASRDPVRILKGPIMRARVKELKEDLNKLIWYLFNIGTYI